MHIEVDYSGRGTTHSILKWVAVVWYYTLLCARSFFVGTKLLSNFVSIVCVADGCWLDDRENGDSCRRTTTNYKGEANTLAL